MGLAGERKKQRIGVDPQNTTWSKDTSRFGFKMLSKMGWTPGKGLGVNEDGNVNHIKTSVKSDQRGLGADANTELNWLENTSGFSKLLEKLNKDFNQKNEQESNNEEEEEIIKKGKVSKDKKNKKEKKDKKDKKEKKTSDKKDSKSKKEKKRKLNEKEEEEEVGSKDSETSTIVNPRLRHRAKYVLNKKMSTMDKDNLKAIFDIKINLYY